MTDRIKQILSSDNFRFNGNVSVFARTLGMEQVTVNNYILGKRKMSLEFICNILKSFPQISAEWLLRGEGTMIKSTTNTNNSFNWNSILGNNNNSNDILMCLVNQLAAKDEQISALIGKIGNGVQRQS